MKKNINPVAKQNSHLKVIIYIFVFLMAAVIVNEVRFIYVESETAINNSYNPRQEIRIVHYRLNGVRCERVIPFEGFRWNVLFARDGNRLRMYPCEGKRIVVVEGRLGWTYEDYSELVSAMHRFEKKENKKRYD